uniref:Polyprotein n=1 Tax=Citrus tristeza virus TaxID=12162 RepID=A0A4Y5USJ5_9CLOS|nr:polyprotein [Citrus tristeza virus]
MSKLRGSFWSSALAVRSDYTISRIWRKLNTMVVLHYFGSVRITKVIRDNSADMPIVPLRKSVFPFSVRAAVRAIRAAGRPLDAPHSGCLCGNPVINASGVVSPRSVAGFSRFSLCKPPLTSAAKKSLRQAKRESVSLSSRASSLFSREVPCGTRSRLRRRVVRRSETTLPEGPQDKPTRTNRRPGKTSHLPYMGEAALDDILRWIEGVNPHPSMVAIPVPIVFGTMSATAWCSSSDAAVLRCRLNYHAAETDFSIQEKHVRYVYNDVSSAANRPRTVSPRNCGRVFPSKSKLGVEVPSGRDHHTAFVRSSHASAFFSDAVRRVRLFRPARNNFFTSVVSGRRVCYYRPGPCGTVSVLMSDGVNTARLDVVAPAYYAYAKSLGAKARFLWESSDLDDAKVRDGHCYVRHVFDVALYFGRRADFSVRRALGLYPTVGALKAYLVREYGRDSLKVPMRGTYTFGSVFHCLSTKSSVDLRSIPNHHLVGGTSAHVLIGQIRVDIPGSTAKPSRSAVRRRNRRMRRDGYLGSSGSSSSAEKSNYCSDCSSPRSLPSPSILKPSLGRVPSINRRFRFPAGTQLRVSVPRRVDDRVYVSTGCNFDELCHTVCAYVKRYNSRKSFYTRFESGGDYIVLRRASVGGLHVFVKRGNFTARFPISAVRYENHYAANMTDVGTCWVQKGHVPDVEIVKRRRSRNHRLPHSHRALDRSVPALPSNPDEVVSVSSDGSSSSQKTSSPSLNSIRSSDWVSVGSSHRTTNKVRESRFIGRGKIGNFTFPRGTVYNAPVDECTYKRVLKLRDTTACSFLRILLARLSGYRPLSDEFFNKCVTSRFVACIEPVQSGLVKVHFRSDVFRASFPFGVKLYTRHAFDIGSGSLLGLDSYGFSESLKEGYCYIRHFAEVSLSMGRIFFRRDVDLGPFPYVFEVQHRLERLYGKAALRYGVRGRYSAPRCFHCCYNDSPRPLTSFDTYHKMGGEDNSLIITDTDRLRAVGSAYEKVKRNIPDSLLVRSVEKDLIEFNQTLVDMHRSRPGVVVPFQMSENQQVMLTRAYPEFNINFIHSVHSDHPVAAGSRALENHLVRKHAGTDYSDVGGCPLFHLRAGHSGVHVCRPVYDVKDAHRRVVRHHQLNKVSLDQSDGVKQVSAVNTNSVCGNILGECYHASDAIVMVQVYDVPLRELCRAMVNKKTSVCYMTMVTPGELLDARESFFIKDLDCSVELDPVADRVVYCFNNSAYTHTYSTICEYMRTPCLVVDGFLFTIEMVSLRCSVNYYCVTKSSVCPRISETKRLRYRRCDSDLIRIKVPRYSNKTRSCLPGCYYLYLDAKFVSRVYEYVVNNCVVVNAKTFEWTWNYIKSCKSRVVISGKIIHRDVPIALEYLDGFSAVMLSAGVRGRQNAEAFSRRLAAFSGETSIFELVRFAISEKCRDLFMGIQDAVENCVKSYLKNSFNMSFVDLSDPLLTISEYSELDVPIDLPGFGGIVDGDETRLMEDGVKSALLRKAVQDEAQLNLKRGNTSEIVPCEDDDDSNCDDSRVLRDSDSGSSSGGSSGGLRAGAAPSLFRYLLRKLGGGLCLAKKVLELLFERVVKSFSRLKRKTARLTSFVNLLLARLSCGFFDDSVFSTVWEIAINLIRIVDGVVKTKLECFRNLFRLIPKLYVGCKDVVKGVSDAYRSAVLFSADVFGKSYSKLCKFCLEVFDVGLIEVSARNLGLETCVSIALAIFDVLVTFPLGSVSFPVVCARVFGALAMEVGSNFLFKKVFGKPETLGEDAFRRTVSMVLSTKAFDKLSVDAKGLVRCSGVIPGVLRIILSSLFSEADAWVGYSKHEVSSLPIVTFCVKRLSYSLERCKEACVAFVVDSAKKILKSLSSEFNESIQNSDLTSGAKSLYGHVSSILSTSSGVINKAGNAVAAVKAVGSDIGGRVKRLRPRFSLSRHFDEQASEYYSASDCSELDESLLSEAPGLRGNGRCKDLFRIVSRRTVACCEYLTNLLKRLISRAGEYSYSYVMDSLVRLYVATDNVVRRCRSFAFDCSDKASSFVVGCLSWRNLRSGAYSATPGLGGGSRGLMSFSPTGGFKRVIEALGNVLSVVFDEEFFRTLLHRLRTDVVVFLVEFLKNLPVCLFSVYTFFECRGRIFPLREFLWGFCCFVRDIIEGLSINVYQYLSSVVEKAYRSAFSHRFNEADERTLRVITEAEGRIEFLRVVLAEMERFRAASNEVSLSRSSDSPSFPPTYGEIEELNDDSSDNALVIGVDNGAGHAVVDGETDSASGSDSDVSIPLDRDFEQIGGLGGNGNLDVFRLSLRFTLKLLRNLFNARSFKVLYGLLLQTLFYGGSVNKFVSRLVFSLGTCLPFELFRFACSTRRLLKSLASFVYQTNLFGEATVERLFSVSRLLYDSRYFSSVFSEIERFDFYLDYFLSLPKRYLFPNSRVRGCARAPVLVIRTEGVTPVRERSLNDVLDSLDSLKVSDLKGKSTFVDIRESDSGSEHSGSSISFGSICEEDLNAVNGDGVCEKAPLMKHVTALSKLEPDPSGRKDVPISKRTFTRGESSGVKSKASMCDYLVTLNSSFGTVPDMYPVARDITYKKLTNAMREFYYSQKITLYELHGKLSSYWDELKVAGFDRKLTRMDLDDEVYVVDFNRKLLVGRNGFHPFRNTLKSYCFMFCNDGLIPCPGSQKYDYALVSNQTSFIAANSFLRAVDGKDLTFTNEDHSLIVYEAPPGGGKTHSLVKCYADYCVKVSCLVVTANKNSQTEISQRISSELMGRKRAAKFVTEAASRVFTVDSYLMNHLRLTTQLLFIDECFMVHAGAIGAVVEFTSCKAVVFFGDSKQIHYIHRNDLGVSLLHDIDAFIQPEHRVYGEVSYRCPWDICEWLSEFYPRHVATANVGSIGKSSVSIEEINGCEDVPYDKAAKYIVYTQAEKNDLQKHLSRLTVGRTKVVPIVNTVHEVQGETYKRVRLVRFKYQEDTPFSSKNHIVVALTRHVDSLVYSVLTSRRYDDTATNIDRAKEIFDKFRSTNYSYGSSSLEWYLEKYPTEYKGSKASSAPISCINEFLNEVVVGSSVVQLGDVSEELSSRPFESGCDNVTVRDTAPPDPGNLHEPARVRRGKVTSNSSKKSVTARKPSVVRKS